MAPVCDFCGLSGSLGSELAPLGGGGLAVLSGGVHFSFFLTGICYVLLIFLVDVL